MTKEQLLKFCETYIAKGETEAEKVIEFTSVNGYPHEYAWHLVRTAPLDATITYFKKKLGDEPNSNQVADLINRGTLAMGGQVHDYVPSAKEEIDSEALAAIINGGTKAIYSNPSLSPEEALRKHSFYESLKRE